MFPKLSINYNVNSVYSAKQIYVFFGSVNFDDLISKNAAQTPIS